MSNDPANSSADSPADESVKQPAAESPATPPATPEPAADSAENAQASAAPTEAASTEAASTEAASTEAASTEAASTEAASTEAASTEAASTEAAAPTSSTAEAPTPSAVQPTEAANEDEQTEEAKKEFNIGSRRGDDKSRPRGSRPQTPGSKPSPPPRPQGPVPVPSTRNDSDELQREIDAALGGQSVDELLDTPQTGVTSPALEPETRVTAQVVRVHNDDVFFSLGGQHEGIGSIRLFPEGEIPELGQSVDVMITAATRDDGLYEVTVPGAAVEVADWSDLQSGAVIEVRITGSNTGGLECKVNNIRGFIPGGQISTYRVENFADYVGKKLLCVIQEVNQKKKNLVLSHRAILEREQAAEREKKLATLEVGQTHDGVVRKIMDFGAFVDIGGVDGLIHVSQLSWERVNHPSDVVSEGEKVKVRIEKLDPNKKKIGLSLRSLQDHPWTNVGDQFEVGATVSGTVSRIANFGAFVKLAPGVEGLVHVSELAHHRVSLVSSIVKEGQDVSVKVLSVDTEKQRISLSIKQTTEAPQTESKGKKEEEVPAREAVLPKHEGPLKGGTDSPSGGEQFGLKW